MSRITKYRALSTEEILGHVDAARQHSDIIEELASRLETVMESMPVGVAVTCPHCEAELTVDINEEGWVLE